jgi:hypothetical protein
MSKQGCPVERWEEPGFDFPAHGDYNVYIARVPTDHPVIPPLATSWART